MIQNDDIQDDIQQVGAFIARLLYLGMDRSPVIERAYDFALSLEKTLAAERPGVPPRLPDYYLMRDASALLVESVEEAEKWLAAWKEQEAEEREAEESSDPTPKGGGLSLTPKSRDDGHLDRDTHSGQMYHPEQEKPDVSPEYSD